MLKIGVSGFASGGTGYVFLRKAREKKRNCCSWYNRRRGGNAKIGMQTVPVGTAKMERKKNAI